MIGREKEGARLQYYRNVGEKGRPKFDDFTWIKAAGEDVFVPNTCATSFIPQPIDISQMSIAQTVCAAGV